MTPRPEAHRPIDAAAAKLVRPAPRALERILGGVAAASGVLWLGVGVAVLFRMLPAEGRLGILLMTAALFGFPGAVLTTAGVRLVRGRSRHRDSLLSRATWLAIGLFFAGPLVAALALLPATVDLAIGAACAAALALASFAIAARPRSKRV